MTIWTPDPMTHKQPVGKRIPLAPLELVLVELQFYMVILVFSGLHAPSLAQHCRFLPLLRIVFHPQVPDLCFSKTRSTNLARSSWKWSRRSWSEPHMLTILVSVDVA